MNENPLVVIYQEYDGSYQYLAPETHDFGDFGGQVPNIGDSIVPYGDPRHEPENKVVLEVIAKYFVCSQKEGRAGRIHLLVRRRAGTWKEVDII